MSPQPSAGSTTMTVIDPFREDAWTARILPTNWGQITLQWRENHALRTEYACRRALVEIDVLAARRVLIDVTTTRHHVEGSKNTHPVGLNDLEVLYATLFDRCKPRAALRPRLGMELTRLVVALRTAGLRHA